jgi:hypothetical protein
MKLSEKSGNFAFYAMMPTFSFFLFSMFMWRGFYIAEAQFQNAAYGSVAYNQNVLPIYWENYTLLAITVACLIIFVASLFVYIYSEAELK